MKPPVDLLIPNYNGGAFLRQTLTGLLRQTYPHFQIVLVDNQSSDDSRAIAREFDDPRLRVIEADTHVPIYANFNRALQQAASPLIALCASDELYEPDWLAVMVDLLERQEDTFFACCLADSADETGRVYLSRAERYKAALWPAEEPCLFEPAAHVRSLLRGNHLAISAGVFRTAAVQQIGNFNEQYQFVGDWEYYFRGLFAGWRVIGTHRPLVHYRRHAHMTTRQLNVNLRRFDEELQLLEWVAQAGHEHRFLPTDRPSYELVRNTMLSECAAQLASGNQEGADRLRAWAEERIPDFRGSAFAYLVRAARCLGRAGGWGLRASEWAYVRLLTALR